ncbi:SDR family NAD(P)-dependent oxidoreductase [Microbacterium hydrocarbonoxydans]|uniref:SDR family NAD(P)-dependent oxidoreductase n=1 Tax=Microbacterium hydrocarbonoxydans TaxID=273678 RepID=UPI00203A91BB|nr:SDR family NAD(P)-dependent oxidoreductase [Microbacterium hydrocarbonoxydans]MCM3779655.1 SDR family oxidoreductase [Microbacterium hydrocarbonoxydans]
MDLRLQGKRAFISGSSQGIGFAIATALAAEGAEVVLNGRDTGRLDGAVQRLRAECPDAMVSGLAADFADAEAVARLIDFLGDVDILVNNVGLFGLADFAAIGDEEWSRYLEVNLMSGVRLSRALLDGMLRRGWGRIVFVSSESGVNVPGDMVHYGVTKAAMLALANGLAKLTRGTAVTVNSVLGGPTYSEGVAASVEAIARSSGTSESEMREAIIGQNRTSLLERFIDPREIAHLAAYLASPVASATNGAALRADGGVLTGIL